MRLETDESWDTGGSRQPPIWMLSIASDKEGKQRYLDFVEDDCVRLLSDTDFVGVPLSQAPRSQRRRRSKSVNGSGLMQRVMELVGIRIEAGVINLDFETEIHRHEMRIRISLAIGIGETHKHTGVVVCSRAQPFE